MKKGIIYARYSSDSQTEQSIEGQIRVCNEYAEKNGIEIIDIYIDRAMSGTTDNRPDFKRMLVDSKKKLWDCVLVYRFDRFSRNKYESVIHKKALKDLGISVISAMENIPDTPEGIILESLLEGLNQYYSAELSQKVKRGMRETRLKGNFQGGTRPYGYDIVEHKLVINEFESNIVKYMFRKYSKGMSAVEIAKRLKRRCIKHIDKPFRAQNIRNLLSKQYYTGVYCVDGEYYNCYPSIIDSNLFNKVQSLRKKYKHGKKIYVEYHLNGLIYCKKCKNLYFSDVAGTSKNGEFIRYYSCKGRRKYGICKCKSYRKENFEDCIYSILLDFISNRANILSIANKLVKNDSKCLNLDVNDMCFDIRNYYKKAALLDGADLFNYLINKVLVDDKVIEIYLKLPCLYKDKEYFIKAFDFKKRYSRQMIIKSRIRIYI